MNRAIVWILVGVAGVAGASAVAWLSWVSRQRQARLDVEPPPRVVDEATRLQWERQAEALGRRIETAVAAGDSAILTACLDLDLLTVRATRGLNMKPKFREGVIRGMKEEIADLGESIVQAVGESGSYKLLRVRWKDGRPTLLFRLISDAGVNYHEYEVDADRPTPVLRDMFVYATGELVSETMRGLMIAAGDLTNLPVGKGIESLPQIQELLLARKHSQAMELFEKLPAELRETRACVVIRVRIAAGLKEAQYLAALEDAERRFAGQGWLNFLLIDCHCKRREWDKANACVDRLDKAIGGDYYLDALRANILSEQGHFDQGIALATRVAERDETMMSGLWSQVGLALGTRRFDAVARVLTIVERQFGVELEDLAQVDGYEEFVKSPEYREWLKTRTAAATMPDTKPTDSH